MTDGRFDKATKGPWTPEHRANFEKAVRNKKARRAAKAKRAFENRSKAQKERHAKAKAKQGDKRRRPWTTERRAKFDATIKASRERRLQSELETAKANHFLEAPENSKTFTIGEISLQNGIKVRVVLHFL